jgi:hypothetical protein
LDFFVVVGWSDETGLLVLLGATGACKEGVCCCKEGSLLGRIGNTDTGAALCFESRLVLIGCNDGIEVVVASAGFRVDEAILVDVGCSDGMSVLILETLLGVRVVLLLSDVES